MSPSKQEGTATAAEQLGSMSLGESAEKKDDNTEPNAENGTPSKKVCSACEKKSDALMKCRACKCVWYCDKECQNKHWKEHRKDCKHIKKELDKRGGKLDLGNEKDVGPIRKLPPKEECPICMRVLPLHTRLQTYKTCYGKTLCGGCELQHFTRSGGRHTCAFCRTAAPKSDEDYLARLSKRVERKDAEAICQLAMKHGDGARGLPVDQAKCIDLLRQSADLGFSDAQYHLGTCYHFGERGLEQNKEEALKFWKKTAEGGDILSHQNLGGTEFGNGDRVAAMRHWRSSASGGLRMSMDNLKLCFEDGYLRHGDLAETLQAFYVARAEMSVVEIILFFTCQSSQKTKTFTLKISTSVDI